MEDERVWQRWCYGYVLFSLSLRIVSLYFFYLFEAVELLTKIPDANDKKMSMFEQ